MSTLDPVSPATEVADPLLPPSPFLADWLFFHAARRPDGPAIASLSTRLTYGELADRVRTLAGHLAARGIVPGSRVLVALPNVPATIVAGLALNALGATSVEISREWSSDVLGDIVTRSGVHQVIALARDARTWGVALAGRPIERVWAVHGEALPASLQEALGGVPVSHLLEDGRVDPDLAPAPRPPTPELTRDQHALILYTSGSTGRPHGVIQTFGNLDANTRSIVKYLGLTAEDRALLTLPLSYCYGRSVLQTHLFTGASIVLETRTAFPRTVMDTLAAEGCTGFAGVPLTFEMLRRQVDIASVRLPRLRYLTQAGGAMALDTIAWAREAFYPARLFVMYGQTEATARLSYLPPERAESKVGSMGIPIPGVQLRVVDDAGHELPPGKVGELIARGANVTPGYLDEPAETAEILRDGWLWTGDLAERDSDGFFYHRGRTKEILKIGGHRISPVAIERVIERHPDVAEAAVIGLPDPLLGQAAWAVVVPRAGTTLAEPDLQRFCRERLPAHQVPVRFAFVDALPRNESGKVLRAELAARYGMRR